jgi:hypothetical protein
MADYISNIGDALMYVFDALVYVLHAGMHPDHLGFSSQDRSCLNQPISYAACRCQKKTNNELVVRERHVLPSTI